MSKKEADFWDNISAAYAGDAEFDFAGAYLTASEKEEAAEIKRVANTVETRLRGNELNGDRFSSMRSLTDSGRAKDALNLPVKAGVRVRFHANAGSVLAYADPPDPNAEGTVIAVKSASGTITAHDGKVFVRWDSGDAQPIHAEHLRLASGQRRQATPNKMRVASLGDLTQFLRIAEDALVHKATRDLWSVSRDGSEFVIERLFSDNGSPLKV